MRKKTDSLNTRSVVERYPRDGFFKVFNPEAMGICLEP